VIHADNEGGPGAVLGYSQVSEGDNQDVVVEIDLSKATPVLYAMLHLDAGTVGEYEFPGDDVPVFVGDTMVNVPFNADLGPGLVTDMGEEYTVEIKDSRFDESDLVVPVGATVVWRYDASLPHTVTADNGDFDSGTLSEEGETFSFTFTEEGAYAYHCNFHGSAGGGGMSGTITVGAVDADTQGDDLDDLY
jgi:plastocyanin